MRFGLRTHAAIASACLAGCAAIAGLDDDGGTTGPSDGGVDRIVQGDDGSVLIDGAPCKRKELAEKAPYTIRRVSSALPVSVDGSGGDWACVDLFDFVQGDRRVDLSAGRAIAKIAMQYDQDAIYLFATVTTLTPTGTSGPNANFKNDSFHWFVMGPTVSSAYTAQDHHIVVDALNQTTDYSDLGGIRPTLDDIAAKASPPRSADNGLQTFDVEIRVTAKTLGRTALAPGNKIRMNFQVNDGPPGTGRIGPPYRVWFLTAAACPPAPGGCDINGTSEPYCNPNCTQELTLE